MTIFVLGGRGKTAKPLASFLHGPSYQFIVASLSTIRSSPYKQAQFDLTKEEIYEAHFSKAYPYGLGSISAVFLMPPTLVGTASTIIKFIKFAPAK